MRKENVTCLRKEETKEREAGDWKVKEPQVGGEKTDPAARRGESICPWPFSLTHGCVTLGSPVMSLSTVSSVI